jgi:hypothetical protein
VAKKMKKIKMEKTLFSIEMAATSKARSPTLSFPSPLPDYLKPI